MWLLLVAAGTGYFARWLQNTHRARPVTSGYGQNPRASPLTSAPSTPRRSSSPPRSLCYDSAIIETQLLYNTNQKVSNTCEGEALPCLETLLNPCLPGFGKGTFKHENSNEAQIKEEATRKDIHSKVVAYEDANVWQQHSFGGIHSDKPLLQVREIPQNFSSEIYISGDSCSKFYACSSPLNTHASSMEDVSVAKLLAKENMYSSGMLDPSHQVGNKKRMESETLLVQRNAIAYEPVANVYENITGKDQTYISSNPHPDVHGGAVSIHNLKDVFMVKDGFNLQTEPLSKFPYGANTILANSPVGSKVSQVQESGYTQLEQRRQNSESNDTNQENSTSENGQGHITKTCNMKGTNFEADTCLRSSSIKSSILSELESSGERSKSQGDLIFGFGLGMAVLFMIYFSKREIQKMGMVLQEAEELVCELRSELDSRKASIFRTSMKVDADKEKTGSPNNVIVRQGLVDKQSNTSKPENLSEGPAEDNFTDDDDSARSVLTEEHVQDDCQISKLEAELEAELELIEFNIHSHDSSKWEVRYLANLEPNLEEHQDFAKGEWSAHCLHKEYDPENDKASLMLDEVNVDDYMVSAVELERRLWNLLQQRQEEQIMELKIALESTENKLCLKEEELQWWKDRVKWLTKLSLGPTSGEESLRNPIEEGSVLLGNAEHKPWWIVLEEQETLPLTLKSLENEMDCSPSGSKKFVRDKRCGGEGFGLKSISRTVSACSLSSEESVLSDGLSFEIVTSSYQGCVKSIQPVHNCKLNPYTVEEPDSQKPSTQKHLCTISRQSNTGASSPRKRHNWEEELSISNAECKKSNGF